MMLRRGARLLGIVAALGAAACIATTNAGASAAPTLDVVGKRVNWCWTDSAASLGLLTFLRTAVTATGDAADTRRSQLYLPVALTSDVQLVRDTILCHAVATVHYQRVTGDPNVTPEAIMLVEVGNDRLVVFDGEMPGSGHYFKYHVYNREYDFLASWVAR